MNCLTRLRRRLCTHVQLSCTELAIPTCHSYYDLPSAVCAITPVDKYGNLQFFRYRCRPPLRDHRCTNCFRIIPMYRRLSWHGMALSLQIHSQFCAVCDCVDSVPLAPFLFSFFSALYCHSSVNAVVFTESGVSFGFGGDLAYIGSETHTAIIVTRITLIFLSAIVLDSIRFSWNDECALPNLCLLFSRCEHKKMEVFLCICFRHRQLWDIVLSLPCNESKIKTWRWRQSDFIKWYTQRCVTN